MTPDDGQRGRFHARRSAAEIARKLLLTVALVAVASVLLPAPPAQADDFERELRRTECRTEAFAEYTQEAGRCLDELSSAEDRCEAIEDIERQIRCGQRATRAYERCGNDYKRRHDREKRRCASLQ